MAVLSLALSQWLSVARLVEEQRDTERLRERDTETEAEARLVVQHATKKRASRSRYCFRSIRSQEPLALPLLASASRTDQHAGIRSLSLLLLLCLFSFSSSLLLLLLSVACSSRCSRSCSSVFVVLLVSPWCSCSWCDDEEEVEEALLVVGGSL